MDLQGMGLPVNAMDGRQAHRTQLDGRETQIGRNGTTQEGIKHPGSRALAFPEVFPGDYRNVGLDIPVRVSLQFGERDGQRAQAGCGKGCTAPKQPL